MLSLVQVMDLARARSGGISDYRLAQLLGVKQPTVSGYRSGRTKPALPVLARLCELAMVDLRCAVLWLEHERAASPEAAELWRKLSTDCERLYLPSDFYSECQKVTVHNPPARPADAALARVVASLQPVHR